MELRATVEVKNNKKTVVTGFSADYFMPLL